MLSQILNREQERSAPRPSRGVWQGRQLFHRPLLEFRTDSLKVGTAQAYRRPPNRSNLAQRPRTQGRRARSYRYVPLRSKQRRCQGQKAQAQRKTHVCFCQLSKARLPENRQRLRSVACPHLPWEQAPNRPPRQAPSALQPSLRRWQTTQLVRHH